MSRTTVFAPDAPAAIGPYAHAASGRGQLFLSGQTPIDPETGALVDGDVGAQTRRVFQNLAAVLHAGGGSLADVVKVNVYLTSMTDFAAMNEVYAEMFSEPYPARTTVAVAGLPLGAQVEIEVVASLDA
ncbi:Rid family detoxifying hydrolase [Microbacterium sp.]|uniref:Rid family detoxifying hydrolase n=1 Tax=Microbacterium sp. TaxID=51671 RepID=UPI0039E62B51